MEQYRLQVATARKDNPPPRLQFIRSVDSLTIARKDGALVVVINEESETPFDTTDVFQISEHLELVSLDESDLIMKVKTLKPIFLTIVDCRTTPAFIKKAASKTRAKVRDLCIASKAEPSSICLSTVFAVFPGIEHMVLDNVFPTSWIKFHQTTKLRCFTMHVSDADVIRGVDLWTFYKKQARGFTMMLTFDNNSDADNLELEEIVNEYFMPVESSPFDLVVNYHNRAVLYILKED
uniref:FTH domain-containing protein n=1 Tax=Panagrellus redivivus TaxID=6233 RepID=A0A7E4ZU55_PANRE